MYLKFIEILILATAATQAFGKDLTCESAASTDLVWEPYKKKWETSSDVKKGSDSLKLINVDLGHPPSKKPALVGNGGAADLQLMGGDSRQLRSAIP